MSLIKNLVVVLKEADALRNKIEKSKSKSIIEGFDVNSKVFTLILKDTTDLFLDQLQLIAEELEIPANKIKVRTSGSRYITIYHSSFDLENEIKLEQCLDIFSPERSWVNFENDILCLKFKNTTNDFRSLRFAIETLGVRYSQSFIKSDGIYFSLKTILEDFSDVR